MLLWFVVGGGDGLPFETGKKVWGAFQLRFVVLFFISLGIPLPLSSWYFLPSAEGATLPPPAQGSF